MMALPEVQKVLRSIF